MTILDPDLEHELEPSHKSSLDPGLSNKIIALSCCRFLPGSYDNKFATDMMQKVEIYSFRPSVFSQNQIFTIERLCRKYKKQIEQINKRLNIKPG